MDFGFRILDLGFWILDFGLDEASTDIVWILHKIFPCHADSGRRIFVYVLICIQEMNKYIYMIICLYCIVYIYIHKLVAKQLPRNHCRIGLFV